VRVDITNIPTGVYFVALIVESETGQRRALNWWPPSELGPVIVPPEKFIGSFLNPNHPAVGGPTSFLEWRDGKRYGLATRSNDGQWCIMWFEAGLLQIEDRQWVFGGGRIRIDVSQGRCGSLSREEIRELGFEVVERHRLPE
jgi:hypothetical protein